MRVLFVDDDPDTQAAVARLLGGRNAHIETATSALVAVVRPARA